MTRALLGFLLILLPSGRGLARHVAGVPDTIPDYYRAHGASARRSGACKFHRGLGCTSAGCGTTRKIFLDRCMAAAERAVARDRAVLLPSGGGLE
jgi:hypothetical protein